MLWGLIGKKQTVNKPEPRRRSYDGAQTVARLGDFSSSLLSANSELDFSLNTLRNRARGLYRNSPHFRRWVNQCQTNIIGAAGLTLQVNAKNIDGSPDRRGNEKVEEKWKEWIPVVTADGMMSFREACRLTVRSWGRDGECFAEIVTGSRFVHGLALHFFEPDMVDETLNRPPVNGRAEIRMGVEIDRFGKPLAYHVLTHHPGDMQVQVGRNKHRRVPADRIIHVFLKDRPGQTRGEPPVVASMISSKMLDGYREAEVTGRRLAASKMGFFTRDAGGSGDLASVADTVDQDTGELEMDVHPGRLTSLPEGMKFDSFDMTAFSTDYAAFERQILHSIAAGLNASYVSVSGDLTQVSYSSIRSGELSDRDVWRELQQFIIEQFAWKVYQRWIVHCFEFSDIRLPYERLGKFRAGSGFRARGWAWVDPAKEIQAAKEAVDNNMSTLTDVVNEQGQDLEEIFRKKQTERELAEQYGVDLEGDDESTSTSGDQGDGEA